MGDHNTTIGNTKDYSAVLFNLARGVLQFSK